MVKKIYLLKYKIFHKIYNFLKLNIKNEITTLVNSQFLNLINELFFISQLNI